MNCKNHREREVVGYCAGCAEFGCDLCLALAEDGKYYCQKCRARLGVKKQEINEKIEPAAAPLSPRAPLNREGMQKLVIHFRDGRLLKGAAHRLNEKLPGFYLTPRENSADKQVFVKFSDLKAVFLVRDFEGGKKIEVAEEEKEFMPEGHEVTVHFKDGEILEGFALEQYSSSSERFHVIPKDRTGNNISVLVERKEVKQIDLGKVFQAKEIVGLSDSPIKKLILCYYWKNIGKTTTLKDLSSSLERTEKMVARDITAFFNQGLIKGDIKGSFEFCPPRNDDTREIVEQRVSEIEDFLIKKKPSSPPKEREE